MFRLDVARAQRVGRALLRAYRDGGVFGVREGDMPENVPPAGVARGDEQHLRLITLTAALDYMRDHDQLWEAAKDSYASERTRYLFDPRAVAQCAYQKIVDDLRKCGLSLKPRKDAGTWQHIGTTLAQQFDGRVERLLDEAGRDAVRLRDMVQGRQLGAGFPSLKGPKISLLWIKILADNVPGGLRRIEEIDVPVDVHTAQATLQTGCLEGPVTGGVDGELRKAVQGVWKEAYRGLRAGFHPLAVEEPLWVLSREGCRKTSTWPCGHHIWLSLVTAGRATRCSCRGG